MFYRCLGWWLRLLALIQGRKPAVAILIWCLPAGKEGLSCNCRVFSDVNSATPGAKPHRCTPLLWTALLLGNSFAIISKLHTRKDGRRAFHNVELSLKSSCLTFWWEVINLFSPQNVPLITSLVLKEEKKGICVCGGVGVGNKIPAVLWHGILLLHLTQLSTHFLSPYLVMSGIDTSVMQWEVDLGFSCALFYLFIFESLVYSRER